MNDPGLEPASSQRTRVLRIIDRLNVGGPARHVVWLTHGLDPARYDSLLVTGRVAAGEGDMSYFAAQHGVEPVVIDEMSRELGPRDALVLIRLLRLMFRFRPDVVHTHKAKAGAAGRIAALLYRWLTPSTLIGKPRACSVVHTFHGHVFHGYYGAAKSRLFVLIERLLARLATDVIVVISQEQRKEIHERFHVGRPGQFRVIPLGIDLAAATGAGTTESPWPHRAGEALVGSVGRLCEVKNQGMLIETVRRLADQGVDSRFVLVGDGHLRPALEAQARELDVADSVVFAGFREDAADLYRHFDLVALTSVNEGTPLTLIEAMRAGVPVVATEVGGVTDLMGRRIDTADGVTLWEHGATVASRDVGAFVRAIRWMLDRPAERTMMGQRGATFVAQRLSSDRLIADIDTLYAELLASSGGTRSARALDGRGAGPASR